MHFWRENEKKYWALRVMFDKNKKFNMLLTGVLSLIVDVMVTNEDILQVTLIKEDRKILG